MSPSQTFILSFNSIIPAAQPDTNQTTQALMYLASNNIMVCDMIQATYPLHNGM